MKFLKIKNVGEGQPMSSHRVNGKGAHLPRNQLHHRYPKHEFVPAISVRQYVKDDESAKRLTTGISTIIKKQAGRNRSARYYNTPHHSHLAVTVLGQLRMEQEFHEKE